MQLPLLVMSLVTSWTWVVMVMSLKSVSTGTSSDLLQGVVPSSMSVNLNGALDSQIISSQNFDSSESLSVLQISATPDLIAISNGTFLPTLSSAILHAANNTVRVPSFINPTISSKPREVMSSSAVPGTYQDEVTSVSHQLKSERFLSTVSQHNSAQYHQSSEIVTLATPMESAMSLESTEAVTLSAGDSTIQIKEMLTPEPTPSLKSFISDQLHVDSDSSSLFKSDVLLPSFSEFSPTSRMVLSSYHIGESEMSFSLHLKTPSLFTSVIDDQMQTNLMSEIGVSLGSTLSMNHSSTSFVKTTEYLSSFTSQPAKYITQVDDAVAMVTNLHSLITRTEQSLYETLVSDMMNKFSSTESLPHLSTVQYEELQSTSTNQAWHGSKMSRVIERTQSVLVSLHPSASRADPSVATMLSHSSGHLMTPLLTLSTQDSMVSNLTSGLLYDNPTSPFLAQIATNPSFERSVLSSANSISSSPTALSSLSSNMPVTSSLQTALYQSKLLLPSTGFVDTSFVSPIRSSMMPPVQSLLSYQLYPTFLLNQPSVITNMIRAETITPSVHIGSSRFQTSQSVTPSYISESHFRNDASFWTPMLVQSSSSSYGRLINNNPSNSYVADSTQFQLKSSSKMFQPSALLSLHNSYTSSMSYVIQPSQTDQLQSSSRKLLEHSQSISNESSREVMATKTSTVLMSTMSVSTYPTLDQSFSTRPFWLTVDIKVPEDTDITTRDFITTMETHLALAYTEGKNRRDGREASVQELLDKLNPDNDPLLNRRKKRAMTVNGNTAQVIDISRHITYPVFVAMVFYIVVDNTSIAAVESKAIFDELTVQELTFYLGVVVETNPTEVIPPEVVMTTPPALASNYVWIILVVIGASGFLFLVCCCCFCICCRRPVKTSRDGPMDIDTLKMLQHKQKYPYKSYKTPNQTPRGFDVAKETDVNNEAADGTETGAGSSGMKLHSSSTASAIRNQLRDTRLANDTASSSSDSLSTSAHVPVVPPLQLQNVQDSSPKKSTEDEEEVFHKAVSSLEMSSRSKPSSRSHLSHSGRTQPRLLPLRTRMTQDVDQRSKIATSSPRSPLTTSREGAELRRLYQEAQNEISQILNPDVTSHPPDLIYIAPDKRRKKKGKSSKRQHVEQETRFDSAEKGQILPDTHYARRSAKQQMTSSKRHPEALSEARRRVHHLIDEAFSLVGLPKNAVSPITPLATDEVKSTRTADHKLFVTDRDVASGEGSYSTMKNSSTFITEHQDRKQIKKEAVDGGTRVVVVPVAHVPDKTSDVVWNPYHAEDELNQLQQSQQLTSSVAGRVDVKYKPDEASHLNMPYPVSVTTPSHEPWMKKMITSRNTDREQPLNQRTHSYGHNVEPFVDQTTRSPSVSLIRHLDTPQLPGTSLDDPYLDPYLKKSSNDDLSGSVNIPEYPNTASEEDPYTMTMSREKKDDASSNPAHKQVDMLSSIAMERRVGKPITDGYDEIDVSRAAESNNLVAAIRDELIRLAKKTGQSDSNV